MSPIRTALWTTLHLPFHIAVVLTVEGSGQWITARRTFEAVTEAVASLMTGFAKALNSGMGGQGVVDELGVALEKSYKTYTFSVKTVNVMNAALEALQEFPDSYWKSFNVDRALNNPVGNDTAVVEIIGTLEGSLMNGIFTTYGITTSKKSQALAESQSSYSDGEVVALYAVADRLRMIVSIGPIPSSQVLAPILVPTESSSRN